jgi:hypothetical protein
VGAAPVGRRVVERLLEIVPDPNDVGDITPVSAEDVERSWPHLISNLTPEDE